MFTQKKNAAKNALAGQKLHSIHALPNGREFTGKIEADKSSYQFIYTPQAVAAVNGRLVLTGSVEVKGPEGRMRTADNVTATLLGTQGSITSPPPMPRDFAPSLKPPQPALSETAPITDWTGHLGSVAVMYLKLSSLDGRALGVPLDLSSVQLNVRLFPSSEFERDLQWLYSALVEAMHGEQRDEQRAAGYLSEINRRLKA
jgi:hypothetical protein